MIFFEHNFSDKNETVAEFRALENDIILGECTVVIEKKYAEITKLRFSEGKAFIIDGLFKAAFYLAGNKGAYMGRCNLNEIEFYLKKTGFILTENGYEKDIPSILIGTCGNCGK